MGQAFRAKFRNAFIAAVEAKLATMTEAERIAFMKWFNGRSQ